MSSIPRSRLFWSVSVSHFVIDVFNASVPVLLTFLSGHLMDLSNTQIGFAISAYQLASAFSQPFAGWLADRNGGRWLGTGGVAWTIGLQMLALVLATTTKQYALLVIPMTLAALGSGAFHPVGAMHASARKHASTTEIAVFFFMGQFGGGVGPAIAGLLLDGASTQNLIFTSGLGGALDGRLAESGSVLPMLILALVSIPSILFMGLNVPNAHAHHAAQNEDKTTAKVRKAIPVAPLLLLIVVVALRGLVNPGLVAFLPKLFQSRGWSPAEYGLVSSLYWTAGAFAGLIAGRLADRYGIRLVISVSLLLSAPAVFLLGSALDQSAFLFALLTGAFSSASHPLIVALTQKLLPGGKGFASGMSLGLIFGTGAVGTLLIGFFADTFGIQEAFYIVAGATVATGLLAFFLPADRPATRTPTILVDESGETAAEVA